MGLPLCSIEEATSLSNSCFFVWTNADRKYAQRLAQARNDPKLQAGTHQQPHSKAMDPVEANQRGILAEIAVARVLGGSHRNVELQFSPWPAGGDRGWDLVFGDLKVEVKYNTYPEADAFLYINEELAEATIRGERADILVLVLGNMTEMWIEGYAANHDMRLKDQDGRAEMKDFKFGSRRAIHTSKLRPFYDLLGMRS